MSKRIKSIFFTILFLSAILAIGNFALAQSSDSLGLQYGSNLNLSNNDPRTIIVNIINIALGLLGIIAVSIVIYAGFVWMTSAGDEEKVERAKKLLINGVIGLVIILLAFGIVTFIVNKVSDAVNGNNTTNNGGGGSNLPGTGGLGTSCDGNTLTSGCQASADVCQSGLVCDPANCTCQTYGEVGTPCGTDVLDQSKIDWGGNDISRSIQWQSFTPSKSGYLTKISLYLQNPGDKKITVSILKGEGPSGNFLTAGTMAAKTGWGEVSFSSPIYLKQTGSDKYTIEIAQGEGTVMSSFIFGNPGNYAGGQNDWNSSADYMFKTYMRFDGISSCSVDNTVCSSGFTCQKSSCTCQAKGQVGEACDRDSNTSGCQADGSFCSDGLFCDTSSCTCQTGTGIGQACNSNSSADSCQVDNQACSNGLTCDSAQNCTCQALPVISWISPAGGFCTNDINKICTNDADCNDSGSTSTCDLTTPNAKVGNLITIGGKYFGSKTGKVYFSSKSGQFNIEGIVPTSINSNCDANYWSDNQIIIGVPDAISGPIKLTTSASLSDATNDSLGKNIPDLIINNITRPGICKISPDSGVSQASVDYEGVNFSASSLANFGTYNSYIAGLLTTVYSDTSGSAIIPKIKAGDTTTFIANEVGATSNYVDFTKESDPNYGPYITSFNPTSGAVGQYVTILGSGFGSSQGTSEVYFSASAGEELAANQASYSFPKVCADTIWSDKQILVKVPTNIQNGNYYLTIDFGNNRVIDSSNTSPNIFKVDSTLKLSPSLCKISLTMGQIGDSISLWGEYFGTQDSYSKVRFYLNKDVAGANIKSWGIDSSTSNDSVKADKVETTIPTGTLTGPVKIVKNSPELAGNSLNLAIGNCLDAKDPNSVCGGTQVCCQAGTSQAGRCKADQKSCSTNIPSSVYEWDFNTLVNDGTGNGTGNDDGKGSCSEASKVFGTCNGTCPNSPGDCSVFPGGNVQDIGVGCSSEDCNKKSTCLDVKDSGGCNYDNSLNRCVKYRSNNCSLSQVKVISGNNFTTSCSQYNSSYYTSINLGKNISCPTDWTRISPSGENAICVDLTSECSPCDKGFECADNGRGDGTGICAVPGTVCSTGSTCNNGQCQKVAESSCSCCCRKANAGQDCCAGLSCTGTCGSDTSNDTNTYGSCGGCLKKDSLGNVNQTASDAACNCTGTTGKFCDAGDSNFPSGVCRDCAQLSTAKDCSAHADACCVDATKNNSCVNNNGFDGLIKTGGISYCGYHHCNSDNTGCVATSTANYLIASSTAISTEKIIKSSKDCNQCVSSKGFGLSCSPLTGKTTCNNSICQSQSNSFSCLSAAGAASSDCGTCCCNPTPDANGKDSCQLLNPNLNCTRGVGPCSGNNRGLCCGCSSNSQCDPTGAGGVGCGNDTCCRARPSILETNPANGNNGVCANSEIDITFDQLMNVSSFTGNVIVAEEYSYGDEGYYSGCPSGTALSVVGQKQIKYNFFTKIIAKIKNALQSPLAWLFGQKSYADTLSADKIYCIVPGSSSSEQIGNSKTKLKFKPMKALDAGRKYFVIARGSSGSVNGGLLSLYGLGLNVANTKVPSASAISSSADSYIWSFTIRKGNGIDAGFCDIDSVSVTPNSYLFQTTDNSLTENDTDYNDKSFDTVADSDKVFTAEALSADKQILNPVSGYNWDWKWNLDNNTVASITPVFEASSSQQLITAQKGITDNNTKAHATVRLTDSSYSSAGNNVSSDANIYVFVCANPWPAVNSDGTWSPWQDNPNGMNCILNSGSCNEMNYELYYCRDSGDNSTTEDDLPVFSGDTTRGSSTDALKESYFFSSPTFNNPFLNSNKSASTTENTPVSTTVCGSANEGSTASTTCPVGEVVKSIDFASFGNSTGSCGSFVLGNCNSSQSTSAVGGLCLGKNSCSVDASNDIFGDPCYGIVKHLSIELNCQNE